METYWFNRICEGRPLFSISWRSILKASTESVFSPFLPVTLSERPSLGTVTYTQTVMRPGHHKVYDIKAATFQNSVLYKM
jgi:hypothetical protein